MLYKRTISQKFRAYQTKGYHEIRAQNIQYKNRGGKDMLFASLSINRDANFLYDAMKEFDSSLIQSSKNKFIPYKRIWNRK